MATIFKSLFSFWQGHLSFLLVTHSIEFVGHFHVILVEKSFYGELEIGGGSNRVAIRSSGWAGSKCEPFFSASNHEWVDSTARASIFIVGILYTIWNLPDITGSRPRWHGTIDEAQEWALMQGASSRVPLNPLPGGVVLLETCHMACIHRGVRQDRMLASYESMLKVIRSSRCRASYTSLEEIAVIKL